MFTSPCPSPEYLEFSFNGLTFWVHNSDLTINKGVAQSEIYGRSRPVTNDTSDKAETFSFSGILSGIDIIAQENAFRIAAKLPLPHIIIHPSFGLLRSATNTVKISKDYKSTKDITTITIDGSDWGEDISCGFNFLGISLETLISAIAISFYSRYSFNSVPSWRMPSVQLLASSVESVVSNGLGLIKVGSSDNWAYDAKTAYANNVGRVEALKVTENSRDGLVKIINGLKMPVNLSPVSNLQDAIIQSTRLMAIAKLIESVSKKKYLTSSHAYVDKKIIIDALRSEINAGSSVGSNDLVNAAYDVKKAYLSDYQSKNRLLSPIVSTVINNMSNSLSVAHQLYGDASRFKEIEVLNPHLNPLFMTGEIYAAAR